MLKNYVQRQGFVTRAGNTWNLTKKSDDSKSKEIAIEEACDCPQGDSLPGIKILKKAIEPRIIEPSISLTEAPVLEK